MASRAAALALKTTAVIAVLATLVLPSLGRCPSLGPEHPLPTTAPAPAPAVPAPALEPSSPAAPPPPPSVATPPAPGPGPAPPMLCSDCGSYCSATCSASECGIHCGPSASCDACRSTAMEQCRACCGNGTCSCDCDTTVGISCYSTCYSHYRECQVCLSSAGRVCEGSCNSRCAATCA